MTRSQLNVFIAGTHAGMLSQDAAGLLSFHYLRDYRGIPLSSAMPISTREYHGKTVAAYLWGLLPENPAARRHAASTAGVSPNNPFALLGVIGLDCPGAVQFCHPKANANREEHLISIDDSEIAHRLTQGRAIDSGWITENEHWSLGGQQNKFALRLKDGGWHSCEGAAATTHIFKSGISELSHQALNEYVCMCLAQKLGIPAARVDYKEFEGEPAIIVERYDRRNSNSSVVRLHQEDLCQALGCLPANKYTMDGGPGCTDILRLLMSTTSNAQINAVEFLQMLFFNYLIAATDAHAKNYSILLSADGAHRLAPMYDVASIAPYTEPKHLELNPPKLAMSIGGENRIGRVTVRNLRKLVEQCGLEKVDITAERCADLLCAYADVIPGKLAEVFDSLENTESATAASELRNRMEKPIALLCDRAKNRLHD